MIDIKLQPYSFLENNINQSMIRQIQYILNIVRRSSDFYNIDHCSLSFCLFLAFVYLVHCSDTYFAFL